MTLGDAAGFLEGVLSFFFIQYLKKRRPEQMARPSFFHEIILSRELYHFFDGKATGGIPLLLTVSRKKSIIFLFDFTQGRLV